MNKSVKKALKLTALVTALLTASSALALYLLYQRPSVRFLLNQTGFREPKGCSREEFFLPVDGEKVSVMVYRHQTLRSDRYYVFQHGQTEKTNRHPAINRLAASLCDATGMTALIPELVVQEQKGLQYHLELMSSTYRRLREQFPGRYRAFGACIGANLMLVAFRRLPPELYPEKMLLHGPSRNGKGLVRAYRRAMKSTMGTEREVDFLFKLATTADPEAFEQQERAALRRAMKRSAPTEGGPAPMKQVSGETLFDDMVVFEANRQALESIDALSMFGPPDRRPDCTYFIIHSKQDEIIPFHEGRDLAAYMRDTGMTTSFVGTEIVSHTENRVTVSGFFREARQLVGFFDRLFEGDV